MERRREQVLGLLWWAAMAGVSWLVLRYALVWLLPFLLALGAAALLEPLIVRAQRRLHLRRSFTAAVLTLVLVGGVLAVLIALAVQVVEQAVALVSSLPELLAALPETMASLERRLEGFCAACPDGVRQTAEHMLDSLPRRAAETMARAARLTIFPLPFPVPPFDVKIYAHQRSGKREATRWLISLLQTLVGESTAS